MTSQLIGRFCAGRAGGHPCGARWGRLTRYAADLEIPSGTGRRWRSSRGLAAVYVMNAEDRAPIYVHQRELLHELVALVRDQAPAGLEPSFRADWSDARDDGRGCGWWSTRWRRSPMYRHRPAMPFLSAADETGCGVVRGRRLTGRQATGGVSQWHT